LLIILFIITGAVFLMSTNDLVSTALAVELQSYGCAPCEAITVESKPGESIRLMSDIIGSCAQREYLPRAITLRYANNYH